ncbi:hypothetical protein ACN47E_008756 [Coniothyrium glycines]
MSFLLRTTRVVPRQVPQIRQFTTSRVLGIKVDSQFVSQITAAEKTLTNSDEPVRGGPTAQAQAHVGQELTAQVIHDIAAGEKVITHSDGPVRGGPTSVAQRLLTSLGSSSAGRNTTNNNGPAAGSGILDSQTIQNITEAETKITGQDGPVRGGPAAVAQQHSGEKITSEVVSEINRGEATIVDNGDKMPGGPTSTAQKAAANAQNANSPSSSSSSQPRSPTTNTNTTNSAQQHNGRLDSATLSAITDAEKKLTGQDDPVQGGPTARAQQHANEPITSQVLHDITEGEKKVTGGERVKGGPTSKAQSELGKSRN